MQWLIDHLAAFIIGATIIFILAAIQLRGQDASIETLQFHAARKAQLALTDALEQDLMNIAAGQVQINPSDIQFDLSGANPFFQFKTRPDRAGMAVHTVRFAWEEDGTIALNDTTVTAYKLTRSLDGTPTPLTGNIISSIDFKMWTLQNNAYIPTVDPARTHRIDVDLTLISPLGNGELIEETRWSRQVLPVNLRRHEAYVIIQ